MACSEPPTARWRSRPSEGVYYRLIEAIGAPELRDNPDFRSNDDRVRNRRARNAAIEERLKVAASDHWIEKLNTAGVPCDRVMTLPEVFADPQNRDQEMVVTAEHPGHREVEMLGFPIKSAEAPCRIRRCAPDLHADTDAVLCKFGYTPEEIARLRRNGVV